MKKQPKLGAELEPEPVKSAQDMFIELLARACLKAHEDEQAELAKQRDAGKVTPSGRKANARSLRRK